MVILPFTIFKTTKEKFIS